MSASTVFDPDAVAHALRARLSLRPRLLLVLGSGLSSLAEAVEDPEAVEFAELPGFPPAGVEGHAGRFLAGRLSGRPVLVQAGRIHLYEGHPPDVVVGSVRAARALGVDTLVLTNAAGGLNPRLEPGSLMRIEDHLGIAAAGVLRPQEAGTGWAPRMDVPYDPRLAALADRAAAELGIPLARGVYAAVSGPSYETPAEVRALARMGADAVGMSTVPEVMAAREAGMSCLALSLITNRAAGMAEEALSHDDVVRVGREAGSRLAALLMKIVRELP